MEVKFIRLKILIACIFITLLISISAAAASDVDEDISASANNQTQTVQSASIDPVQQTNINDNDVKTGSGSDEVLSASSSEEDILSGTRQDLYDLINDASEGDTIELNEDYTYTSSKPISITKKNLIIDGKGHYIDGNFVSRLFTISYSNTPNPTLNILFKNITFKNAVGSAFFFSTGAHVHQHITFDNCTFLNSFSKTTGGGAIFVDKGAWKMTVNNCKFINNSVGDENKDTSLKGGAIFFNKNSVATPSILTVNNSLFDDNKVFRCTQATGGGAIYVFNTTNIFIYSSNFTNNKAYGVNLSEGSVIRHTGNAHIENCNFYSNYCESDGTVFSAGDSSRAYIVNSVFKDNYAKRWGGALQGRNLEVVNTLFIDNVAGKKGGAAAVRLVTSFVNCNFTNNTSPTGGAISYDYRAGTASVSSCNFIGNSATDGGAIYSESKDIHNFFDSKFINNTAKNSGGACSFNNGNILISGSEFTNNSALVGGAIYEDGLSLKIVSGQFYNNYANSTGGAIRSNNLNVKSSSFNENQAIDYGGALYVTSSLEVQDSTFTKNVADCAGAAFTPFINSEYVTFSENYANTSGALHLEGSVTKSSLIENSKFLNNNATNDAGAIYMAVACQIDSTDFISNNAGNDAGAIFWKKGNGRIYKSNFVGNKAEDAGAIYIEESGCQISLSTFEDNYAKEKGGAIYWYGDSGKILSSTFDNNTVGSKGASVYWYGVNGTIESSTFDGNYAASQIYWHGADGNIKENVFNGTRSVTICQHGSATLTQNNQINTDYNDYSIYNEGNASFDDNDFFNAIYNNGLILTETSVVVLDNKTIVENVKYYDVYTVVIDDNGNFIKLSNNLNNTLDGGVYATTFNNTHYVFKTPYLNLGIHPVNVVGTFSELLQNTIKPGMLMYMILEINTTVINNGEKLIINTTVVNTTENGTVDIFVNGKLYPNVPLYNGSAILVLDDVLPGRYVIDAYYGVFNQTLDSEVSLTISARSAILDIIANNITAGQNTTIVVNLTKGATGIVYIFVNNEMYTKELTNSSTNITLNNLPGGNYSVFAIYNGDSVYKSTQNSTQFSANKIKTNITIETNDIYVGDIEQVVIKVPSDITGKLYLYVDNKEYAYSDKIIIANLTAGNHTVRVIYAGDYKYLSAENTTVFRVLKKDIDMAVTPKDIKVGEVENIKITTPDDAKGSMILFVNGVNYYLQANETIKTISGLPQGSYNLTLTYLEDDLYNKKTINSSFKVDFVSIDPKITYTIDKDLNAIINITIPSDVTGDMLIEINGKNYTAYNLKGKSSVTVTNLTGGSYPATFYLKNDPKYGNATKKFTVTLSKIDTRIHIDAPSIFVDENATITVNVVEDAEGNVTLKINNKTYSVNLTNGVAVFTIPGLAYGSYDITAIYSGDRKYNRDTEDEVLIVQKIDIAPYAYMSVDQIFVGENATINITMPDDAYGKVNITIQGKTYGLDIINGRGQINISGLKYGVPVPIHAEYYGNEKYYGCQRDYTGFAVHRISNYDVEILTKTNSTGVNITVKLPSDANGTGIITINNKTYDVTYSNGEANISVDGLEAGKSYEVYAYFAGNDKYTANDAIKTLNSNKTLDYIFLASAKDINVGETAYIVIQLPNATNGTDRITVKVPGQPPVTVPVDIDSEGIMLYPVNNLKAGSYQISVTYHGNDKYEARSRYGNLSVSKINYFAPVIEVNTPHVGENLTFNITLPKDAEGNVTVTVSINNTLYNTTVINGTAQVVVPGLPYGNYTATVFYSGDDKYNNRTQLLNVTVLKIMDFKFDIGVSDIFVGENETIYIYLPEDVSGTVKITIDGTEYVNVTVDIKNGVGVINASGLNPGEYNVSATLSGDPKYEDYTQLKSFRVSVIDDYTLNLHNVTEVNVRDNITVIVDLPKDAGSNATLNIFGQNITSAVINGTATFKVPTTTQGNFLFTVSYEETGKYGFKSVTGNALVSKVNVVLNPQYNSTVGVGEKVVVKVQLPSDATGNISLSTRGIPYSSKVENGTAIITIEGYLVSSMYSPVLRYTGDEKYNPASITISINVTKVDDYELNVTVDDIDYGQTEVVNVTLPSDATDDVLISGNFSSLVYSVHIINGNATFLIKNLLPGTYSINVRYQGFIKYSDKNVTKVFTVRKIVPDITVDYVNNNTIVVTLPDNVNGVVNITVGNVTNDNVAVVNGVATLDISDYLPGNYSIIASFGGDEKYLANKANKNITVPKVNDYILPIAVSDITVGENAIITVTLPEHADGSVNLTIDNGSTITVPVINGTAKYSASGLTVGKHNVSVNYANKYYSLNTNTTSFNVNKIKTVINSVVSGNATNIMLNVTLTEGVNGNLTIVIDNVEYTFENITSNKINLTVDAVPKEHDIVIKYSGDENHTAATKNNYIVTTKISDYNIIVDAKEIVTVLENNVVTVTLPNGTSGSVAITINGNSYGHYAVDPKTGKATFKLPTMLAGDYTIVAEFSNKYYQTKSNSTDFTVVKLNTTIEVNVSNITKDLDEVINITLNESIDGEVIVDVNGLKYAAVVEDGITSLQLSNLNDGNYTVVVTYKGDDLYNSNSTTVKFSVYKMPVVIKINGTTSIVSGQNANFNIETSRNITDMITVTIGNKNYTAILYNGKANLTVSGLAVGEYNVTAIYLGDNNYLPANDTMKINVTGKKPSAVSINVSSITVGDKLNIQVNVTKGATGIVSVVVEGEAYNVNLVDGKANLTISNLSAREYQITAYYRGDVNYLTSNATAKFTVNKKQSDISVNVSNIFVGEVEIINITVPENATGHVLITLANVHLYADINGVTVVSVPIADLPIGSYNVTVVYNGDDTYENTSAQASFNITKHITLINITTDESIIVGHPITFNIATSANITEVVIITIGGKNYTTFVENGIGTYTVYDLVTVGNYTAEVFFAGNSKYDVARNQTKFNITGKLPVSIDVEVANITLGENAIVYVNVTGAKYGKIILTIAGATHNATLVDGKCNFTLSGLLARDYHITVMYEENDNYLSNITTANFTVFKKQSQISLNVTDIYVGGVECVNVTVTPGATGVVLISIAGIHIYAEINGTNAIANIVDLSLGEYNVTATYLGDENYLGSSANATFNVTKLETTIEVKGNNITVGQTEILIITTSANLTEVVTLRFINVTNGKVVNNYTTFVKNGEGKFIVPYNLLVGNYTVIAYFAGNNKYDAVENSTVIQVSPKKASAVNVQVQSITIGENVTIFVNVTEGTTGNVAISLAGNSYTVPLNNSKANITFSNLTARNYHVSVFYFGDEYYLESSGAADFVVNKKVSQVNVTAVNITVDQDLQIDISITNGTTGVVLIDINGTDYYSNIVDGSAKLVVKNLAVGEYIVTVDYNGDSNYNSSTNKTKFKVSKLDSTISVAVVGVSTIAQGNDVLINVTGPKEVTGVAVVSVVHNGGVENYTVYINNGQGLLIISEPHVGQYNVTAKYDENYKYNSNTSNTAGFEVYASGSNLDVDTRNIFVGENETITVTVEGDYNGKVVNITIDGNINLTATLKYNAVTNSSVGIVNYTGRLKAGIHQVDAAFVSLEGDKNITHSGNAIFIVSKNNSTVGIDPISDSNVGKNVTIDLTLLPSDATGTVDVYVNGILYKVNVNNLTLTISNLPAGKYVVQAMYNGDDKYLASSANRTFEVFKNNITLNLEVENIDVGQPQYLNVTLESDAVGYVLININGTHYYAEIKDGVARVNITDLGLGKYVANVTFIGDDKYYGNTTSGKFEVSKLNLGINITASDIFIGQDVKFVIESSANITEVVIIEVGGKNYTAFIENGKGEFALSGLSADTYEATVYFPGNSKYDAVNNKTTFQVKDKQKTSINVTVADITVGEDIIVNIEATKGINGSVYVTIAGVAYERTLVDGKCVFNVSNLIARDYVVSAFFMGNNIFEPCNTTSNFTVHKKNTPISINVTDIKIGDSEIINVTVDSNATGNVLISIGSVHVYAEIKNGVATANITGLTEGIYNVTVTYTGDGNYTNASANASFKVSKLTTSINITCAEIIYVGQSVQFTIATSANLTEVVTITIGADTYHTFVENGKGSFTINYLPVDNYTAVVNFAGNVQYNPASNKTDFKVLAKKPSDISISVDDITVGQNATIKVTVTPGATGNITLVIAGNEHSAVINSTTGEAVFNISGLSARHYEVTAIYDGDKYYDGNSTKDEFNVYKAESTVNITVSNIVVGDVEIINVTVTPGATGVVLINVSGTCYYADLDSTGKASLKVAGLSAGQYEVKVIYTGDDKFKNSTNTTTFVVNPEITVVAGENDGNNTELTIDVGDNSSGNATIVIDGKTYTAKVENGTAKVNVTNATPGKQDVQVIYTPDGKQPNEQNKTVDIPKVSNYPLDVKVVDVDKKNGTATVVVQAPKDATGNVTIDINGTKVTVPLDENGTAKVTIKDIPVGSHDVDVSYGGDNKYVSKSNRTHVNMPINLPTVNVVDHLIRGWNSQFDYEAVFTDEFGEVLVDTTVTFIVNGKSYNVKTEAHGIAKLSETLPIGEYEVTSFNTVTKERVTKKLSIVPRLIHNKDLTMDFVDGSHWDVLVIGDDGKPVGEGEIIDIYVNTIHYVAKTGKDGVAKLKINLNPKNYKITAEYKKYKVSNKLVVKQTLKLVKKTVSVKKGKSVVLKATLKWSNGKVIKNKKIVFKFKGKKYTAKTNSKGLAKVTIKGSVTKKLKKGKSFTYTATYITNTVKGKIKVK